MERRRFLAKTGILAAAGAAAVVDAPNVIAQQRFQWRMSTTWTPALDVLEQPVHEVLPRLLAVGDDVDARRFLFLERHQHGVALALLQ